MNSDDDEGRGGVGERGGGKFGEGVGGGLVSGASAAC